MLFHSTTRLGSVVKVHVLARCAYWGLGSRRVFDPDQRPENPLGDGACIDQKIKNKILISKVFKINNNNSNIALSIRLNNISNNIRHIPFVDLIPCIIVEIL